LANSNKVIAAGRMALVLVIFAAILVGLYYQSFRTGLTGLLFYEVLLILLPVVIIGGRTCYRVIRDMFQKSKGLSDGGQSDWLQLVTILAAAFGIGGAFQSVSTIDAETVSISVCAKPAGLNFTSPNCLEVQTLTQTHGPFTGLGLLGVWLVVLGAVGAVAFGVFYLLLRLKLVTVNGSGEVKVFKFSFLPSFITNLYGRLWATQAERRDEE